MRIAPWLVLGAALLVAPPSPAEEEPAPTIDWQPDLAKAREAAKAGTKPLVLYFTFDT